MKKTILIVSAVLAFFATQPAIALQSLDHIVAVVNDGVVMASELDDATAQIKRRYNINNQRVPEDILKSQVLDHLILRKIQLQHAKRAGLYVGSKQVNKAMANIAQQNNMDLQQFRSSLQKSGIPLSTFRRQLHDQLLTRKLQQKAVAGRIVVTKQDVDRYLKTQSLQLSQNREYHLRHILIAVNSDAGKQAVHKAQQLAKQVRQDAEANGASFTHLAITYSDGRKALQGGDLGWLRGGIIPTLFQDIVPKLQPGDISKVFRGPGGFHIIQLVGTREAGTTQSDKQQPNIVKEVHLLHILLRPNEIRNSERTHKLAEQLYNRLLAGDDFAELARQYSDDTRSSNQGGDLDWIQPGRYPPAFASHLPALQPGDLAKPFKTAAGWHIVKLVDRRTVDKTKQRRRNRVRQILGNRKMQVQTEVWLRQLRDEAYVDIRMPGYRNPNAG